MKITIHNVETNEVIVRDATAEEITASEKATAEMAERQAQAEAKAEAKATAEAKLVALGLDLDDLRALGL